MKLIDDNKGVRLVTIEFTEKELFGIHRALMEQAKDKAHHCIGGPEDAPDVLDRKILEILEKNK